MSLYNSPEDEAKYQKRYGEMDKKISNMTNEEIASIIDEHAYWYIEYIHDSLCEEDESYWDCKMEAGCIWEAVRRLKNIK
jgi:hypothetical protein